MSVEKPSPDPILERLGFDERFLRSFEEQSAPGEEAGRIVAVHRDRWTVRSRRAEAPAEVTGKMHHNASSSLDLPAVGDWVQVRFLDGDTFAVIDGILPRRTFLARKIAGKTSGYQVIAANVDRAFIIQSADADFNLRRLERYLAAAREGGIEPVFLLSKTDLLSRGQVAERVSAAAAVAGGAKVVSFSSVSPGGLDGVRAMIEQNRTFCLLGSSGVGKTTLLNALAGEGAFRTREVREKDGKGRHTTTSRQLVAVEGGGLAIDTPGMRELGTIGVEEGIAGTFGDIGVLAAECRFTDCTHEGERGCAVLAAVAGGDLDEGRYRSYLKLRRESERNLMSHVERRRRDKDLGRFYKSVMKEKKRSQGKG